MSNAMPGCITLYAGLNRDAFDDADRRTSGHDARETKTRPAQQGAVLLFRTLLSTRHHKHRDVQQLSLPLRDVRHDRFRVVADPVGVQNMLRPIDQAPFFQVSISL